MATSTTSVFRQAEQGSKLVQGNTQFAWNLFRKISQENAGQNVFYSPASISIALGMTYLGARGDTQSQMNDALGFSGVDPDHLHTSFEDLHSTLHDTGGNYTLHTANRLYGEQTYNFLQPFLDATKTHYKAELVGVNYKTAFEEARQQINQWVEQQTNDKIKDLLAEGVLDSLTRLVLVNAIYFKGNWAEQFKPQNTKPGDFYITKDEKIKVQHMFLDKKLKSGWSSDFKAKALELPYVDNKLSMFIVVPDKLCTLDELENKLTYESLHNIEETFKMWEVKTQVTLPKFKFSQSFSMGDVLSSLGMTDLFTEKADLSGIDGTRELFVSKVIHKAFIEVNEEGSEAAAATAVKIGLRSMPKFVEFYVNQPFLFFIRENQSKSLLFFGRVNKPEYPEGGKDEL